jgi:hypothetical protein
MRVVRRHSDHSNSLNVDRTLGTVSAMTSFTESELAERRPLWEALSTLFLDTDTSLDRAYRVRVLASSRFTTAQLESILLDEVYPVCALNLLNMTGVWTGFDPTWLESEICRRLSRVKRLRLPSLGRLFFRHSREWTLTKQAIANARGLPTSSPTGAQS